MRQKETKGEVSAESATQNKKDMGQEEVLAEIGQFISAAKDWLNDGKFEPWKKTPQGKKLPDLYPGYAEAVEDYLRISIHTSGRKFPREKFEKLLTSMGEKEIDWIEQNYEPVTHGVAADYRNTIYRAFNGVELDWTGVDQDVIDYLQRYLPKYNNIEAFYKHVQLKIMLDDAMGVNAQMPESVEYEQVDENTFRISGEINPTSYYFECWRVLKFEHEKFCLVISSENSEVLYGGHTKKQGLVFYAFTDTDIFRVIQVGKQVDWTFDFDYIFPHDLGVLPVLRNGGTPKLDDNQLNYESYLKGAIPFLNLAMHDSVQLMSVKNKCAFPTPVMLTEECDYHHPEHGPCKNGRFKWRDNPDDKNFHTEECPSCKGSGKKQALNAFSTMFVPVAGADSDHKYTVSDVLTYVSPDSTMITVLRDEVNHQLAEARDELKIHRVSGQTGNVTATEKGIDFKATIAAIKPPADMLISREQFGIDVIVKMKFGAAKQAPQIKPIRYFDLKTEADYIEEISMAIEKGLPTIIIQDLVQAYLFSKYDGSEVSEVIIETIIQADRLYHMGALDAIALGDKAQKWEMVLNNSSWVIALQLLSQDADWWQKDINARVEEMQTAAKALAPAQQNPAIESI